MAKNYAETLDRLFHPNVIAVFGSVKKNKIGHQLITQLVEGCFAGRIVSVNPKAERPEGFPAIKGSPKVQSAANRVDLALIAVPAPYVEQVLEDCGREKVPFAVVFTSGFSEVGNTAEEESLKKVAGEHGIRLIGPNCAGIMNTGASLYASIEVRALPGKTAFITQSGAVGGAVLAMAKIRGIGFSKFVSYGNRADIGEVELLRYLEADPETEVIALYLESLDNGREFMETVRRVSSEKPVVIIKSGRSSSGLRAASSHTGSMAGSDEIFEAMVKQSGALRVPGIEEMLDLCDGLSGLPRLKGNKFAIITNSGGPGILTSDRAEELGLDVQETGEEIRETLHDFLPEHCALDNPIDLTVEGTRENYRRALKAVLDSEYDGVITINVATPFLNSVSLADGILEAVAQQREPKPVAAVFMAGDIVETGIERLKAGGVPVFPTGERAAYVLAKMCAYYNQPKRTVRISEISHTGAKEFPLGQPVLEPEAVEFLQGDGFLFPEHAYIRSGRQLKDAASRLGFPLVMKIVSPQILHKSDRGGVMLNIGSQAELEAAYRSMEQRFSDKAFQGTMLYSQVQGGSEIITGIKQDPDFGPVVLVGAGGVLTELLQDSSLRIAPFDKKEAFDMLAELKISKLFSGFRGEKPLDQSSVADLLVLLSRLSLKYPAIRELDFNPVFVFEKGLLIGDVRIVL